MGTPLRLKTPGLPLHDAGARQGAEPVTAQDAPAVLLIRWPGNGAPSVRHQPGPIPAAALAVAAIMDQGLIALRACKREGVSSELVPPALVENRRDLSAPTA